MKDSLSRKEPQKPNPNDGLVAALILTREQWIELVEAVTSKSEAVHRGDYPPMKEGYSSGEWYDDLRHLREVVLKSLADQGINL